MDLGGILNRFVLWLAARPVHTKVLLALATTVFVIELGFRYLAPRSEAYRRWTKGFEAVGAVWTAVLLSVVYLVSVGPVSLFMRAARKDLLDRALSVGPTDWKAHEPNPLGPLAAARHQF